jgi:acyl dehydratase
VRAKLTAPSGTVHAAAVAEQKLFYEDVSVGDEAPAFSHELTRTDLVRYAGASGDFNPIHHDEIAATSAGLPSVFGHGMFTMGMLGKALTDYVGVGNLRSYKVRFTKQTWPGEELTTRITVAKKYDEDGEHRIDLECEVLNASGEAKVSGVAIAAIPPR